MAEGKKDIVLSIRGMSKIIRKEQGSKAYRHGCAERINHGFDG